MDDFQQSDLPISKTKRKQQAKAFEQIAEQLAAMPETQFSRLQMAEELVSEVRLVRETSGRSSHKRQLKHLAAVLRQQEEDQGALLEQLQGLDQVARSEKRDFHRLEDLRDRLCEKTSFEAAFAEMLSQYPQIDRNTIARLARSVHQHADKRAFREIFRRLREAGSDQ